MQIVSKKQAMDILKDSLFHPVNRRTLSVEKFDSGKYQWTGSAKDYIGREVPDCNGVHAVYVERRQDKNGAYCQTMAIVAHKDT